jgi:endo-alpha-1,4-polygalactosaminidase (GH114 family)
MRTKLATAAVVTQAPQAAGSREDAVAALRQRLAGTTAREHVVLDFLSDDLREARDALGSVETYVGAVEKALSDERSSQDRLMALAMGGGPIDQLEYLSTVLLSVRRRLAQVAARM